MNTNIVLGLRITIGLTAGFIFVTNAISVTETAEADPWVGAPQSIIITAPPRLPDARDMITRDPFTGGPKTKTDESSSTNQSTRQMNVGQTSYLPTQPDLIQGGGKQPVIPGFPGTGPATVPNPGGLLPQNGQQTEQVRIIGTVTGEGRRPVAMISDGQHVDFAHIGDTLSGKRITDIKVQGIVFEDGSRMAVSDSTTTQNTKQQQNQQQPNQEQNNAVNQLPAVLQNRRDSSPAPTPTNAGAVNPPGGGPVQTTPYTPIQDGAPPTITPGNYNGAPPTLSPGSTEAPIPRYISPNQEAH